ncbi:hypothetical protein C2869_18160 [Saccharobesus litoralis]|uniref:Cytoskeleton protein RodZ-like C-terminal domain-containing protein n=1 Tax=Saccharobesus litoralis TaxID=2172099 RepID=A0A2S0VVH3_9ALTE|nr:RodZ domain-containing protein [Saccharobesus litoralis]AWB68217.1 hypothetical protein C2869_18160 [Saccharobesus litoralis]
MMTEKIEQEQLTESQPTPGQMLQELRELQKLSRQDVADSLNLKIDIIEKIEKNQFKDIGTPLFVRGYLKSCAKLYGIEEESVMALYDAMSDAPQVQRVKMTSFSRRTSREAHDSRLMLATYIIIAIVILSFVLWWWQRDQAPTFNSLVDVVNEQVSDTQAADPTSSASDEQKVLSAGEPSADEPSTDELAQPLDSVALDETPQQELANQEQASSTAISAAPLVQDPTPKTIAADSSQQSTALLNVATPDGAVAMELTFIDDCWLVITDATGREIANGVKKKGYVMPVSGVAPVSFVLGAPENVSMTFDGKTIDMTQFKAGRVARFSLPFDHE